MTIFDQILRNQVLLATAISNLALMPWDVRRETRDLALTACNTVVAESAPYTASVPSAGEHS